MNEEEKERQRCLALGQYVIAVLAAMLHGTTVPPLPKNMTWQQV